MNEPIQYLKDYETPITRAIKQLVEIYRMRELPPKTRINIIMLVSIASSGEIGSLATGIADQFIALLKDQPE